MVLIFVRGKMKTIQKRLIPKGFVDITVEFINHMEGHYEWMGY